MRLLLLPGRARARAPAGLVAAGEGRRSLEEGGKMKKSLLLLLLLTAGCSQQNLPAGRVRPGPTQLEIEFRYVRDEQTGICFAVATSYRGVEGIATVPCTDEVLRLVK